MKYPLNRPSKPIDPEVAKALSEAIEAGKAVTNPAAQTTIQRILKRRNLRKDDNEETNPEVR